MRETERALVSREGPRRRHRHHREVVLDGEVRDLGRLGAVARQDSDRPAHLSMVDSAVDEAREGMGSGWRRHELDRDRFATGWDLLLDAERRHRDAVRDVQGPNDEPNALTLPHLDGVGREAKPAGGDLDLPDLLVGGRGRRRGRLFRRTARGRGDRHERHHAGGHESDERTHFLSLVSSCLSWCQGRSKIRPPWRRKTRPLGRWVEWRNAAVRRGRQDAGVAAGWRAFLLCSRR